nr:MAG TPA: Mitochondrial import receptor subunit TOM40 protein, mitochondrial protein import [Caudoviricetes sp.]
MLEKKVFIVYIGFSQIFGPPQESQRQPVITVALPLASQTRGIMIRRNR